MQHTNHPRVNRAKMATIATVNFPVLFAQAAASPADTGREHRDATSAHLMICAAAWPPAIAAKFWAGNAHTRERLYHGASCVQMIRFVAATDRPAIAVKTMDLYAFILERLRLHWIWWWPLPLRHELWLLISSGLRWDRIWAAL